MKSTMIAWPLAALVLVVASAASAAVTVTIDPGEGAEFAERMGLDIAELEAQLTADINEVYALVKPGEYLTALNDAQAFSSKGLGVDYASNPTRFVFGVTANVAASVGDDGFVQDDVDQPVVGLAPNLSVMVGMNFAQFGAPMLTIYANGFARSTALDQVQATLRTAGLHAQIKLGGESGPDPDPVLKWGGIDLTSGIEYSFLGLNLERPITSNMDVAGSADTATVKLTSDGTFDVETTAISIPFEASTNLRLLYFVSVYGGLGIDIQLGGSTMEAALNGDLHTEDPRDGSRVDVGTANITASEEASPSTGKLRFFAGTQLNLSVVKAFVQANLAPNAAVGVAFGGRIAW